MKKTTILVLLLSAFILPKLPLQAQNETNQNKLSIWLWYIDIVSKYDSHEKLAAHLSELGVKRIFTKVYDQNWQTGEFPELRDSTIPKTYNAYGIECWAWAYNYPFEYKAQGNAVYTAAQHGYQGYILDIEEEFNGKTDELHQILQAHVNARDSAISDGIANSNFPIYCTTWGNPADHNMHVEIIDLYVDAHMPQTYLEAWGPTYMNNATYWVNYGTEEYRTLGATKPIHHIISSEGRTSPISIDIINEVFKASGNESSLWSVPINGLGSANGFTDDDMWEIVDGIYWNMDVNATSIQNFAVNKQIDMVLSNNQLSIKSNQESLNGYITISDIQGSVKLSKRIETNQKQHEISIPQLKGCFIINYTSNSFTKSVKAVF